MEGRGNALLARAEAETTLGVSPWSGVESPVLIRPAGPADLDAVLALNQAELPHVSALTRPGLERLTRLASSLRVAEAADGALAGFLLAMTHDAEYESPNFRWFQSRHPSFHYVDRIIVSPLHRRTGVASALYRDLEAIALRAGVALLTCEVNVRPPNPGSHVFHARLGFVEAGTQDTERGTKTVVLYVKTLTPPIG